MTHIALHRFKNNFFKRLIRHVMLLFWLFTVSEGKSQCLPILACQPNDASASNLSFGMGIYRVKLGELDTVTNGAVDGYQDYSCRARAARLVRGGSFQLVVRTSPSADEAVRAWIDYNRDGSFTPDELVLSSGPARQHTATFAVPATAPVGAALRLRIAADYANAPVPTACSTPQYSQTEDYRVVVSATASLRPQVRFAALDSISCGASVAFRDQTLNTPTQWHWRFGDGAISTQQHPQHTYAQPGTYVVSLRACNSSGCDSLIRNGYITVRADGPRAAACAPATAAYCCGYGLTRVRLAGLDHRSADAQAGYEDFSCAWRATLTAERPDTLHLTTGLNAQDVRVYLDINDDGQLTGPGELLYQGLSVRNPVIPLNISTSMTGLVYDRALRLRIVADSPGSPTAGSCTPVQHGQAEDYSVVVRRNMAAPAAAFTVQHPATCGAVQVTFTNQTTGGATAYRWDFGDGTTSTLSSPPAHTYTRPGTYDVRMIAENAFGRDTTWRPVVVAEACPAYCTPSGLSNSDSPAYFTRVSLGTLNNTAFRGAGRGYFDFTAQHTALQAGRTYNFQAESLPFSFAGPGPWVNVTIWLDANQDGFFTRAEILGTAPSLTLHEFVVRIPPGAKVGATRLRVAIQRYRSFGTEYADTCTPAFFVGSTEDYTVVVLPVATLPLVGFTADLANSCSGTVQFRDTTYAGPTSWRWNFGDGTSATTQHPRHTYTVPGTYTVSLTARNRFGTNTATRTGYVAVTGVGSGPQPAACLPQAGLTEGGRAIDSLIISSVLSYSQPTNAIGYLDETCTRAPIVLARNVSYSVTLTNRYGGNNMPGFIWLDVNEDGRFDTATELLFNGLQSGGSPRSITLPPQTPLNRPLRLRVLCADYNFPVQLTAVPDPCARRVADQLRDFTVMATATTLATAPSASASFTVYPNPTQGKFTIQGISTRPTNVRIHDLLGRLVWQGRVLPSISGAANLNLSALPRGSYIVELESNAKAVRLLLQ
ncbi:PKD domain-containing protein [Hymenobacter sp. NST-14]|uniref:PKD domain-containing protein n=1 Tax=Hymenobacter piscis TaxID=2839984 RepID=UPI001C036D24|nr:PKD domain-containing protein [Hymenobacter piscis]MBT9395074.1 PKD domain-containing protein [Hymenobacter piscis]